MRLHPTSIETLNKLFAETAELSGYLSQFTKTTEHGKALIQTLGIVQMICRVMLEETGEITPLDIPEARRVFISIGRHSQTGVRAVHIGADNYRHTGEYDFSGAPAMLYELSDGSFPEDLVEACTKPFLPMANLECSRLRIVTTPTRVRSEPSAGTEPARSNTKE